MTYANGQIPDSELVQAANGAPGQTLIRQTAAQWAAMVAAAAVDGITLKPASESDGIASCYRSIANQRFAKQKESQGGASAATPGTSPHGDGNAVDVAITAAVFAWLSRNAARFGFDNVVGQRIGENWHWVRSAVVGAVVTAAYATAMQTKLVAAGYKIAVDGKVGAGTVAALRDFQGKHGLVVDGLFGPKSEAALGGTPPAPAPAPTPAPASSSKPVLKRGDKSDWVRRLQAFGNRVYPSYCKLIVDGDFGDNTEKFVKEFQRRAGLKDDGIVGPATWAKLGL